MMDQVIIKKLKEWRNKKSQKENREPYMILHNKTIENIALNVPKNKEEFLDVNGLGEKKFQRYGTEILGIIHKCLGSDDESFLEPDKSFDEKKIYSVSDFLDLINTRLLPIQAKIKGEVSSVDFRDTYLFFGLKDPQDESILQCFMWKKDYDICGVGLKEGMELTVYGFPEVYKKSGRFSIRTEAIQLVGEGVLKKAYEELKKKLSAEGLFDEARKKPMPIFPIKIGVVTSRHGDVINDLLTNLDRFGYQVSLYDSRVEGSLAVKELIEAVQYFKDQDIDILTIIRGGGSLESLQAFNNEALIREIVDFPVPVLCGIGHEKDVPLISLVADKAVSTPSIVAKVINQSWEKAVNNLDYYQSKIFSGYSNNLQDHQHKLSTASVRIKEFYQFVFGKFEEYDRSISKFLSQINYALKDNEEKIKRLSKVIVYRFKIQLAELRRKMDNLAKQIQQNSPERQLKLGYSIVSVNGKIIKSTKQVQEGDRLVNRISDGKLRSEVEKIYYN